MNQTTNKTCPPCHGDCEQGKYCPAQRSVFGVKFITQYWAACFVSAVISAFTVAWFMAVHQHLAQYDEGFESGFDLGYKKGGDDALRTNPVSARLEHACTSIWISEQVVEQHKRGIK